VAAPIKEGADVNEKNNQNALHSAAANGQHAVAQLLLSAEAKVNAKEDRAGRDAVCVFIHEHQPV